MLYDLPELPLQTSVADKENSNLYFIQLHIGPRNMGRKRHLLITGALGHIGSALIRDTKSLIDVRRITMVDDMSTQRYCSLFNLPSSISYTFLEGDVGQILNSALLKDVDAVIHLAGAVDPVANFASPEILVQNNLRITECIARACESALVPLIFSSSTSVYTPTTSEVDETETALNPQGAYAQSKLKEEELIRSILHHGRYLIFRFGSIFGPSIGMRFQTAINKFCYQASFGRPIDVWRTAMHQFRPYLAISDCTSVLGQAASFDLFPNTTINAVTCNATVMEILDCIRSCGIEPDVIEVDNLAMNSFSYRVSNDIAVQAGFTFEGSLLSGVSDTLTLLKGAVPLRTGYSIEKGELLDDLAKQ